MPTFKYIGGLEFNKGDDLEPTARLPAETTAFGIEFLRDRPVDVEPRMFRDQEKYEHAVRKLRAHAHFQEVVIEDAKFTEIAPDRPAKKAKAAPVEAPQE